MSNNYNKNLDSLPKSKGFRLRGLETTRLDTFVDAAFAFATTMLVISIGNIPRDYQSLTLAFKGIPSFLFSFASIAFIWYGHRRWSRRYGVEDVATIIISLTLVFVLLIYVYPLRLIFSALFSWVSGGFFPSEFKVESASELVGLFAYYGFGYFTITVLMGLLHLRSLKLKQLISLNKAEILFTKLEISTWFVLSAVALFSAIFALVMPLQIGVFAGFVYSILPIIMPMISIYYNKKIKLELK
ncbi:MAG: TMEM175 family protein [Melioribacteraceae bacterium]